MPLCYDCPRQCGVERPHSLRDGEPTGACSMPVEPVVARAALHFGEEPCISGTQGSGTVFFSGCSLRCVFCQNYGISAENFGEQITVARLREIYRELICQGAHNINLVNPTHFVRAISQSLEEPLPVPVVYNCGGYESVESLLRLEGKIQVYLPDFKYADNQPAARYSGAPDYFERAAAAVREMVRQTGPYRLDAGGMLCSGVLIRHLILPGQIENSKRVIDWVADSFPKGSVLFSLMSQYLPCGRAADFPEINRPLRQQEYDEVEEHLFRKGVEDGFLQELSSADSAYIPAFDLTGVRKKPDADQ
ncbi:MAG: radical SAM protein [Oscillospiraceae bacterium]|nr:radical SAM protein [Oscillospiraceae bacterium]